MNQKWNHECLRDWTNHLVHSIPEVDHKFCWTSSIWFAGSKFCHHNLIILHPHHKPTLPEDCYNSIQYLSQKDSNWCDGFGDPINNTLLPPTQCKQELLWSTCLCYILDGLVLCFYSFESYDILICVIGIWNALRVCWIGAPLKKEEVENQNPDQGNVLEAGPYFLVPLTGNLRL